MCETTYENRLLPPTSEEYVSNIRHVFVIFYKFQSDGLGVESSK